MTPVAAHPHHVVLLDVPVVARRVPRVRDTDICSHSRIAMLTRLQCSMPHPPLIATPFLPTADAGATRVLRLGRHHE